MFFIFTLFRGSVSCHPGRPQVPYGAGSDIELLLLLAGVTTVDHQSSPVQERNVRTVPLIVPLQMGHFLREGAHSLHTTRWPQGMKTRDTSRSIHTLHVLSSWSFRNCSSIGRAAMSSVGRLLMFCRTNISLYNPGSISCREFLNEVAAVFPFANTVSISVLACKVCGFCFTASYSCSVMTLALRRQSRIGVTGVKC